MRRVQELEDALRRHERPHLASGLALVRAALAVLSVEHLADRLFALDL